MTLSAPVSPATPARQDHIEVLDGFRAIAILTVMAAHAGLDRIVPGGLGVTLFFFLSGYLITTLLIREQEKDGRVSLGNFYLRRLLRLGPPLVITLGIFSALAVAGAFYWTAVDAAGVLYQLSFLSNYSNLWCHCQGIPQIPLWSLAVEEHFYFVFPLLFAAFATRLPALLRLSLALCGGVLALRLFHVLVQGELSAVYYWSHTRIDSILYGCCLALATNARGKALPRPGWSWLVAGGALLLVSLLVRDEIFRQTLRYSIQGIALGLVFAFALFRASFVADILKHRAFKPVANWSYTLYLVHFVFLGLADHFLSVGHWPRVAIAYAAAFAYAALMYILVERPIAAVRRRLHRHRGAALAVVPTA